MARGVKPIARPPSTSEKQTSCPARDLSCLLPGIPALLAAVLVRHLAGRSCRVPLLPAALAAGCTATTTCDDGRYGAYAATTRRGGEVPGERVQQLKLDGVGVAAGKIGCCHSSKELSLTEHAIASFSRIPTTIMTAPMERARKDGDGDAARDEEQI
ncbi:hypothetical protein DFJ73DRAFT_769178 [Zopfochytrium polystomum]|nr:hypothetical protein DFJ73DRAFT_769178 [Zopfochytrium polystomum]